ncbi:MAG: hypothetical protein ACFB6S_17935 [Geminicoccaceae bacterium]
MSLLHVSISATKPQPTAEALATLLGGVAKPFPPFPGSWIAFSALDDGTAIEVYPTSHTLKPGPRQIDYVEGQPDASPTFVHLAIGSPLDHAAILDVADTSGWLARLCDRGPFECVEVWIDDRLLVEVLSPDMVGSYREGMTVSNWASMFDLD